jgi:hypothetical protein
MKNPALIGPISRVFSDLLRVHDYLSLLEQVEAFDLSPDERDTLVELRMVLERDDASHAEVKGAAADRRLPQEPQKPCRGEALTPHGLWVKRFDRWRTRISEADLLQKFITILVCRAGSGRVQACLMMR